jgi:hypothetical protein
MKCVVIETNRIANTSGEKERVLVCYCDTTACNNFPTQYYPVPKDFSVAIKGIIAIPKELDCDCEYETVLKDGSFCGKCEKRFYDSFKVFKFAPKEKQKKVMNPIPKLQEEK